MRQVNLWFLSKNNKTIGSTKQKQNHTIEIVNIDCMYSEKIKKNDE